MGGLLYVIGITIIGICDTLNGGVEKRAEAQDIRSAKLEMDRIALRERVAQQQQKMTDDMKKRQARM